MTDRLTTLKGKIESEHKAFELTVRRGLAHIREIGRYLIECQAAAKAEGVGFRRWIESEFAGKFSYPTAWNWMSVAKHWDEFSEDDLTGMTMKQMLKAVADRNRWSGEPPEDEAPVGEQSARSGAVEDRPPLGLAAVPASEGDGQGEAAGVLEHDRRCNYEAAAMQTPGGEHESGGGIMSSRPKSISAVTSPSNCTTEDRVESVARELDIPADKLRAALVRHGILPPAGHL